MRRRAWAWAIGFALAAAGGVLVIVDPGERTYLIGLLLLFPLGMVALARGDDLDEDERPRGGAPSDPSLGMPDF